MSTEEDSQIRGMEANIKHLEDQNIRFKDESEKLRARDILNVEAMHRRQKGERELFERKQKDELERLQSTFESKTERLKKEIERVDEQIERERNSIEERRDVLQRTREHETK